MPTTPGLLDVGKKREITKPGQEPDRLGLSSRGRRKLFRKEWGEKGGRGGGTRAEKGGH